MSPRGGARAGAGRKETGSAKVRDQVYLPESAWADIEAYRVHLGLPTVSQALAAILEKPEPFGRWRKRMAKSPTEQ